MKPQDFALQIPPQHHQTSPHSSSYSQPPLLSANAFVTAEDSSKDCRRHSSVSTTNHNHIEHLSQFSFHSSQKSNHQDSQSEIEQSLNPAAPREDWESDPHVYLHPVKQQFSQKPIPSQSHSFPTPNLYRISLQLTTELDIQIWWDHVIETFTTSYHASRLLLSVPHDLTDTINTPWGVKAIYDRDNSNTRPDSTLDSASSSSREPNNSVFESLQPLDSVVEPLVDNRGILKILQEGKLTIFSRKYRPSERKQEKVENGHFLSNGNSQFESTNGVFQPDATITTSSNSSGTSTSENSNEPTMVQFSIGSRGLDTTRLKDLEEGKTSYFPNVELQHKAHDDESCNRRDYEDSQQSPGPAPFITDPNLNPFFPGIPEIDDTAFNPSTSSTPASFDNLTPPLATDNNIYSIVHIPLIHPTTAKNVAPTNTSHSPVPIAILSFLSSIVPYPQNLICSLNALSPFLATTFSTATIHQQILKQLPRRRSIEIRKNGITPDIAQGIEYSSDECSTDSSSLWEYATVFSAPSYFGPSPGTEKDDPFDHDSSRSSEADGEGESDDEFEIELTNSAPAPVPALVPVLTPAPASAPAPVSASASAPASPPVSAPVSALASASAPGKKTRRVSLEMKPSERRSARRSFRADSAPHIHHITSSSRRDLPNLVVPNTKMLRIILDVMPNCVYTCSRSDGECTWVNNRMLQYTGLHIEEILGNGWLKIIHHEDRQRVWEMWRASFSRGEGFSAQYRMRRFDGQYRWFLGRAGPLRDARGVIIHWFGTCTDVHDQKLAEERQTRQKQVEAEQKKYRQLAEAIPQIVFTATSKEGIDYVNDKWFAYTGLTFEQTQHLGFLSHVHHDDRNKCVLPDLEPGAHQEQGSHHEEVRLMSQDGSYRWFLVKCISVESSDQKPKWFGTCTDINDHKLLEHKLKEAHDAAQKSTESKTRFLSNMSHEIRTPLIGITGMINFMLDTNLTVEQLDYAHTIQQSADALLLVINDILDLSKVEAGMMKLAMEPFSIHNMVEDANELLSTLAIQKGLELNFIVEDDVPDVICGDRIRLRQVLLNVIGNAIKFTSDGEVFSRCSVQKMDAENNEVELLFQVLDTGSGFDAEEEAVMFKPFSQVDTSSTRKHGGSGLGLVISRQLIELHGGKMTCTSKKGVGSTFYFSAKFKVPPESTAPRPQTPTTEVSNSPFFRYSRASVEGSSETHEDALDESSNNSSSGSSSFLSKNSSQTSTLSDNSSEVMHTTVSPSSLSRPMTPSSRPNTPSQKSREKKQIDLVCPASVLIIAELSHSLETLVHYVRSILPKEPEPELCILQTYTDAYEQLEQPDVKPYTHILINLAAQNEVISLATIIKNSLNLELTDTVILTTPIQRAGIMEGAQGELPKRVDFIFKPPNRSKMEGLFDTTTTIRENFLKRRNTHQIVASQKELFKRMAEDVGGRGLRVLLVEDNFVNRKVLIRYLNKVGLEVTVANDGLQCLNEFYSHSHDYFSLILCDLFMPVKDGYETTKEIRAWEAKNLPGKKGISIIALSANVFSDVASKCDNAGFNTYVSKPVNFGTLSDVIRKVLCPDDRNGTTRPSCSRLIEQSTV